MFDMDSVPQSTAIAKSLTPQQRRLWQKVTNSPASARNRYGRIRAEYLATAWPGGTDAVGWRTLVRVTIWRINRRFERRRIPVRILGKPGRATGGYVVVSTKERAA